jgi:hypothetical protein
MPPKFKLGDSVERIDPLCPPYMHTGQITRVIPNTNPDAPEWLTEYEIDFGYSVTVTLYERQLRLVKLPTDSNRETVPGDVSATE